MGLAVEFVHRAVEMGQAVPVSLGVDFARVLKDKATVILNVLFDGGCGTLSHLVLVEPRAVKALGVHVGVHVLFVLPAAGGAHVDIPVANGLHRDLVF